MGCEQTGQEMLEDFGTRSQLEIMACPGLVVLDLLETPTESTVWQDVYSNIVQN